MTPALSAPPPSYLIAEFDDQHSREEFVADVPVRRHELSCHFQCREFDQLLMTAHHLREEGCGYGFPGLSHAAAVLERACLSRNIDAVGDAMITVLASMDRIGE